MSDQKVRRKTFLSILGITALGWLGARASGSTEPVTSSVVPEEQEMKRRVRRDPRAVRCSGRTL